MQGTQTKPRHVDGAGRPAEMRLVGRARLLDADPQLATVLEEAALEVARRHVIAPVVAITPGSFEPTSAAKAHPGHLGLLMLDGLILRDTALLDVAMPELLGPGDIIRPWEEELAGSSVEVDVLWTVAEPTRVAVLDREVASVLARWPELVAGLLERAVERSRHLAVLAGIGHLKRVDQRLLALLWHLADRFGKVESRGVIVPMRLTHELLAAAIGARRPSTTTALRDLGRRGLVSRDAGGAWILHGGPPEELLLRRTPDDDDVDATEDIGEETEAA
jgi:CRP/FNR family transcriptional regulator, cyclic AMP receptor protein